MSKIYVNSGEVTIGSTIGAMGSTGKSTGTHLHLAVWDVAAKKYVNPKKVIPTIGGKN